MQRERTELLQSSLTYRDRRLVGHDAAAVVEVIEHLDPPRLGSFERNLFGAARPGIVVPTTPNIEHNVRFEGVPAGSLRCRGRCFQSRARSLGSDPDRDRRLGHKRSLAVREFALGIEALERFVRKEPLYRVHEPVFGVLALESEPVDPRL